MKNEEKILQELKWGTEKFGDKSFSECSTLEEAWNCGYNQALRWVTQKTAEKDAEVVAIPSGKSDLTPMSSRELRVDTQAVIGKDGVANRPSETVCVCKIEDMNEDIFDMCGRCDFNPDGSFELCSAHHLEYCPLRRSKNA